MPPPCRGTSLLLPPKAEHTTNTVRTTLGSTRSLLSTSSQAANNSVASCGHRASRLGNVATLIIPTAALSTVDSLAGKKVSDGLAETALANLAGNEVVDAVLERVDLLDARHLRLVEGVCGGSCQLVVKEKEGKGHTTRGITGFVVCGKQAEVEVLEPLGKLD